MKISFRLMAGGRGLVYLMMLGRRVKVSDLWSEFEQLDKDGWKIITRRPTVYSYVNRLEDAKLVRIVKGNKKRSRGNPKYREAVPAAIFDTLARYELFKERRAGSSLELLFNNLNGVAEVFPHYLFARAPKGIRSLGWHETLSIFLEFNVRVIQSCFSRSSSTGDVEDVRVERPEEHLQHLDLSLKEGKINKKMHKTMSKADRTELAIRELNDHVASMSEQKRGIIRSLARDSEDIYRPGRFLFNLKIASIVLRDPERGGEIYDWAVKVANSNKTENK